MDATRSVGLRLPVQAAVHRTPSYGALADGTGVDASQDWGKILGGIAQNIPWGDVLSGIGSVFGF
jgi:hypothetical protein